MGGEQDWAYDLCMDRWLQHRSGLARNCRSLVLVALVARKESLLILQRDLTYQTIVRNALD